MRKTASAVLVEEAVLREAERQIEELHPGGVEAAIVTGAPGWHPGVVGIVASRLMRRHHRPVLVIAFDERGVGKGSGRSIAGYSLVAALEACGEHLQKHGGHEMAAGLSLEHHRFEDFRRAFLEHARRLLTAEQLAPKLHLDAEIALEAVGHPLLAHHDRLQPFGMGNPQPLFLARGVAAWQPAARAEGEAPFAAPAPGGLRDTRDLVQLRRRARSRRSRGTSPFASSATSTRAS